MQNYLSTTAILQQFIDQHKSIQGRGTTGFYDQLVPFAKEGTRFPLMYMVPQDVAFESNSDIYTFRVYCVDLLQKDRSNEQYAINHTLAVLRDFSNWVEKDLNNGLKELYSRPKATPVTDFLTDFTVGWYADVQIETTTITSDCFIPFFDVPLSSGTTQDVQYVVPYLTCETLELCGNFIDIVNNSISSQSISAVTFYSGSTNLANVFVTSQDITRVQPGTNITTGGTGNAPIISVVASPSFNNLTASGTTNLSVIQSGGTDLNGIFVRGTGTPGTIAIWSTSKSIADSLIIQLGTGVTINSSLDVIGNLNVLGSSTTINTTSLLVGTNQIYLNTGGTHISAVNGGLILLSGQAGGGSSNWLTDANGNWSANTSIVASNLSATTFYSAGTNLDIIIRSLGDIIRVQPGLNITTGGTVNAPIINTTTTPTFTSVSATSISASTLYSGTTNLDIIIRNIEDVTRVQAGTNVNTGGTANAPVVNVSLTPTFTSVSATSISATTLYSGSTNLDSIIRNIEDVTRVQPGTNVTTGGTGNAPVVNVSLTPTFTSVSATSISATTFYSGTTPLQTSILTFADVTRVQPGANINTGGTANAPIVKVIDSPSFNNTTASGTTFTNTLQAPSGTLYVPSNVDISGNVSIAGTATTINTQTIQALDNNMVLNYSGSHGTALNGGITIEDGVTNGTDSRWTIDSNGNWSANTSIIATNVSGSTLYSGSTNLYQIFATTGSTFMQPNQVAFGNALSGLTGTTGFTWNTSAMTVTTTDGSQMVFKNWDNQGLKYGGLWLSNVVPSSTNVTLVGVAAGANTYLNSTFQTALQVNGSTAFEARAAYVAVTAGFPFMVWKTSVNTQTTPGATDSNLDILGSTATVASMRIRSGVTVTSPKDGEMWQDGLHLNASIGGIVRQLDNYLPTSQVAYGSSTSGVSGSTGLVYSGTAGLTVSDTINLRESLNASNYGALYSAKITAASNNYSLQTNGINTYVNGTSDVRLMVNDSTYLQANAGSAAVSIFRDAVIAATFKLGVGITPGAGVDIVSSSTYASLRIRSGSTISSPNDGDIWYNGKNLMGRIEGRDQLLNNNPSTGLTIFALSATSVSATTFYSGSTNLETIIYNLEDVTRVQNGSNTSTGGTGNAPTVNVSANPAFTTVTTTGNTSFFGAFSSTTISGGSIYSTNSITAHTNVYVGDSAASTGGAIWVSTGNTNPSSGIAILSTGGKITVNTQLIKANSYIFLTANPSSGAAAANLGSVYEEGASRVPGTSFVIASTNPLSVSEVVWLIIQPF